MVSSVSKAEWIYREYFAESVNYTSGFSDHVSTDEMRKRMKNTIMQFIQGCLNMGVHVHEITHEAGVIVEIAYYGAGGKHEDLE